MAKTLSEKLAAKIFGDFGSPLQLYLNGQTASPDAGGDSDLISLNLTLPAANKAAHPAALPAEKALPPAVNTSPVATISLGNRQISAALERKPNVGLLRNYAENSVWVRAAIDYYRRTAGRAQFEIVPLDTTVNPSRRDKQVKTAVEAVLAHPNLADQEYAQMKEQFIEDYMVIGHGALELDLNNDLTVRGVRVIDAANLGFIKSWDGTEIIPRYVEFDEKKPGRIKRLLMHEQVMCLVNRPRSYAKTGFSHVESLHRTVAALLSGDEFLIKQIIQPVASSLIDLGEGATKQQVEDFKYQISQVRDQLAVIGGSKSTHVHRLAATADEMRILDGQEWFVRQVAAVFGISTAKLKLAVDTSRANTNAMFDDDLEAVTGELTRIEELESSVFIKRYSYLGEVNLQFFYPIMHRKDEKTQAQIARVSGGQAWTSMNESRSRTGEKLLDEKDFPFVNEPLVSTGKFGPLPMSVYAELVEEFRKQIKTNKNLFTGGAANPDDKKDDGAPDANGAPGDAPEPDDQNDSAQ